MSKKALLSFAIITSILLQQSASAVDFAPENLLSFSELSKLSTSNSLDSNLESKLNKLLRTTISKQVPAQSKSSAFKKHGEHGEYFRVSQWNIERGFNIDTVKQLFTAPEDYLNANLAKKHIETKDKKYSRVKEEIELLRESDVFVLSEVDYRMSRTEYKNIAEEFAAFMGAGYAFATEFVEVDPNLIEDKSIDQNKYKGLHGNAIISKFPITDSWVLRLPQCYDWYQGEQENISLLEKSRRASGKLVFNQEIVTEIRRGNRMALIAELEMPNKEKVSVISTHLEDRATPRCRAKQINYLLDSIKHIDTPVVLAGDFNSFETDISPTNVPKLYKSKISDPGFLARTISSVFNPLALVINTSITGTNITRKFKDPTSRNIPILMQNKAREFFNKVKNFRFDDGGQFDFSGQKQYSYKKKGLLSNSNQRWLKGFVETFQLERSYKVIRYKIDWLFVKPKGTKKNKKYFPAFGRTLKKLNYSFKNYRIADHTPTTVEILVKK